jgi:hypothetical protein
MLTKHLNRLSFHVLAVFNFGNYLTLIISILAVLLYASASHAQALFILEMNAGIMRPDYVF